jgi:putative membrane protein
MSAPPATDASRRTRLANERTFLAWWRTALSCEGLAVAIGEVLPEVGAAPHWSYVALGLAFALLGMAVAAAGWWRYAAVDRGLTAAEEAAAPIGLVASLAVILMLCGVVMALLIVAG